MWALFFRNSQLEKGEVVSFTYSKEVKINLSEKNASLLFANLSESNRNMIVQLIIQDNVIIQSELLTSGKQVTVLELLTGVEKLLSIGEYEGKFNILYYDPETKEKLMIHTEISVTINVIE